MKILAIRGENLASLARRFEVDLDGGPLADAGLFAIVGETGAGKTTLLDAMCAALFDKTPRLEGHSGFKVGHGGDAKQRLGTADVRGLVRNGEAAGWAEVDFEGRDRRRYRARWEVQRARKKLDGNWQDQRMKLVRLDDGLVLGGTRTETLQAIRQVLGLSYDEFCRSALLAQFQFARFLKASASERAELLERMTGTRIYGDVSKAAHERARLFADERRHLIEVVAAIGVLGDEARAALAGDEATARGVVEAERALTAALAQAAAWRTRAAALAEEVARGDAAATTAQARRAAAADRARELAAVERVGPVRPAWQQRAEAARRLVLAEQALVGADERVRDAAAKEHAAQAAATAAHGRVGEATALVATVTPALARARGLDAQVVAASASAGAATAAAGAASARAREAAARVEALERELAAARDAVASGEVWLGARSRRVIAARDPVRWRAVLARAVTAQAAQAAARAEVDAIAPQVLAAETALATATAAVSAAYAAHETATRAATAAEERARPAPLAPAERAATAAEARARGIAALAAIVDEAGAVAAREQDGVAAGAAAATARAVAAAAAEAGSAGLTRSGAQLEEAEGSAARLRVAAGHEAARAELAPGDECPVCGATEHPWRGGVVDALVAEQDARVKALRLEVDGLRRAVRTAEHTAQAAAALVDEHGRAVAAAAARRGALEAAWRSGLAAIGELPLVASPATAEAAAWIAAAAAEAVRRRADTAAARDVARGLADEVVARQAASLAAAHAFTSAKDARDQVRDAAAALVRAGERAAARRDEQGRVFDDARVELGAILTADELRALGRDAAAVRDTLAGELDACVTRLTAVEAARAAVERLRPERAGAVATADELARAYAERARAAQDAGATLVAVRAERAGVLGGRDADLVERELTAVTEAAAQAERTAAAAVAEAGRLLSSTTARRDAAVAARADALAEHATAAAAVATALAGAGLAEAVAASLLGRDAAWLAATRAELAAFDAAVTECTAIAADRRRQAAEHAARRLVHDIGEAGDVLDLPDADFAARVAAATTRVAAAAERLAGLEVARRGDDAARGQHARAVAAAAELDVRAWPYEQLAAVIGSADGKELRNFAQSLSLDALLAAANHHLDQLAARYQLGRVPGLDLELHVIDREMGGDARAVNSLSGGESFLVSLALALGLSSMAAADVEVRTLFIDEGFGSLDPATLDAALAVLDTLRASGRQVGIVSHVAELEDRVAASVAVRAVGGGRSVVEIRSARS